MVYNTSRFTYVFIGSFIQKITFNKKTLKEQESSPYPTVPIHGVDAIFLYAMVSFLNTLLGWHIRMLANPVILDLFL